MKLRATVITRQWGGSCGVVVPSEVVHKLKIRPGDTLAITIEVIR